MTEDDKLILAYVAGVLTVAVVLPGMFVLGVKYVPPFREAVRAEVVRTVDESVAGALGSLPPDVAAAVGVTDAFLRVQQRITLPEFVHRSAAVPAGDYVVGRIVSL